MIDLDKLSTIANLVHSDIAENVRSELFDVEEQKVYDELYEIHVNLVKEFSPKWDRLWQIWLNVE